MIVAVSVVLGLWASAATVAFLEALRRLRTPLGVDVEAMLRDPALYDTPDAASALLIALLEKRGGSIERLRGVSGVRNGVRSDAPGAWQVNIGGSIAVSACLAEAIGASVERLVPPDIDVLAEETG